MRARVVAPMLIGVISVLIGSVRLVLGNSLALTDVLWAEDGLFPLCVRSFNPVSCTMEPFAGYLLLVPRVTAIFVAAFPLSLWPLLSVTIALTITGVLSVVIFVVMRSFGLSVGGSTLASLMFVLLPLTGLEVIGVVGSIYQPLLIACAIAVIAVPRHIRNTAGVGFLLFLTALTTPLALVVAPFIFLNYLIERIRLRAAIIWSVSLTLGLIVQAIFVVTASTPRKMDLSFAAVGDWVRGFVNSLLSIIPGINLGEVSLTPFTVLRASPFLPWMIIAALFVLSGLAILKWKNEVRISVAGQLVLFSLLISFISIVSGNSSYRHFVSSLTLSSIAAIVLMDRWFISRSPRVMIICLAVLLILWIPAFPASDLRTSPGPAWSEQILKAKDECSSDGSKDFEFQFTPAWPPNELALSTKNLPRVSCESIGIGATPKSLG